MPGGTWTDQAQVEPNQATPLLSRVSANLAKQRVLARGVQERRAHRGSGQLGHSGFVQSEQQCRNLVFPVQRGREHWRVVGVDRHRQAGRDQGRKWVLR